jgi:hypothetical protein
MQFVRSVHKFKLTQPHGPSIYLAFKQKTMKVEIGLRQSLKMVQEIELKFALALRANVYEKNSTPWD